MARKPTSDSIRLSDEIAAAACEVLKGSLGESSQILWQLYEGFRNQKITHILDRRVSKEDTVLFLGLVNAEAADRLPAKKRHAIMNFIRRDPILTEKYLNSGQKPILRSTLN